MDRFQKLVWSGLVAALSGIAVAYFVTESRRSPLPVIAQMRGFALTNQLGNPVSSSALKGRVTVVNVIFTQCPIQCPKLSQQMARVQQSVPEGVRLVSLTADPVYDSPAVLQRYAQRFGADPARWWFLTGEKVQLYRFATEDLKFNLLEASDPLNTPIEDRFIHSTDFSILDRAGSLRALVHGEEPDAEARITALVQQLLRETNL
jgi:protein SCO1/2